MEQVLVQNESYSYSCIDIRKSVDFRSSRRDFYRDVLQRLGANFFSFSIDALWHHVWIEHPQHSIPKSKHRIDRHYFGRYWSRRDLLVLRRIPRCPAGARRNMAARSGSTDTNPVIQSTALRTHN